MKNRSHAKWTEKKGKTKISSLSRGTQGKQKKRCGEESKSLLRGLQEFRPILSARDRHASDILVQVEDELEGVS